VAFSALIHYNTLTLKTEYSRWHNENSTLDNAPDDDSRMAIEWNISNP